MNQPTFAIEQEAKDREKFLERMDGLIPESEPFYQLIGDATDTLRRTT